MRQESGLSQAGFARLLWAHKRTVQRWEAGTMRPTGAALALLTLVKRRGIQILT
ncbi:MULTISPECIES: helix-turn-helix domain-containing protein [Sphingomonadaceae]|uniref:XRE family transcriptional regulator n=8 Tax=Sphingomonadales TaxID=204457 RepID=A0A0N9VFY3_SPHMC|nr:MULTISPECIES: helix-turn-helix domain-containing protein [Sphingomonadaceae]AGH52051.1 XRE family transcriptional regulator [Sphingomonas sp. MM-1]ALH83270.1 XRE family transcriptional regulator [Sphingopyxis macrogoltabida]EZP66702.1 XRE family transcriptional regulator [Sphingomonas paucimobilis]MBY2930941.1 helix-turn-helix domain-containing protein [Sphingomonadales bacterium 56]MBY2961046.1 helix-turn-helix domain-containing protein [Sphingomonadales bacterium 58]MCB2076615.1 helix-tu